MYKHSDFALYEMFLLSLHLVEEPGFKNVKNKHFGMSPF